MDVTVVGIAHASGHHVQQIRRPVAVEVASKPEPEIGSVTRNVGRDHNVLTITHGDVHFSTRSVVVQTPHVHVPKDPLTLHL